MDDQRTDRESRHDISSRRLVRIMVWLAVLSWVLVAAVYFKDGNPGNLIVGGVGFIFALLIAVLLETLRK